MGEYCSLGSYSTITDQGRHSTCQAVGQAAVPVLGSVRGRPGAQQPGPPRPEGEHQIESDPAADTLATSLCFRDHRRLSLAVGPAMSCTAFEPS